MSMWKGDILNANKLKSFNVSNYKALATTTNFGTTGQNNKAIDSFGGLVCVGSANGKIAMSSDNGMTFGSLVVTHPFGTSQISCVAFNPAVPGQIAAVTETGVIGISTDYGATFVNLANSHGGSSIAYCVYDNLGILHVCGAAGKYSHSTTSACTAMSALIDIGFGSIIADCICVIDLNTIMVSGHSNRLNRSTDGGATWTGLITTPFNAADALWNVQTDGKGTVVLAVYDSSNGNTGKYAVSTDKGLTFGQPISSFFTTGTTRIVRVKYLNGVWLFTGDGGYIGYTMDIQNSILTQITNHSMLTGIIYGSCWTGVNYCIAGATGRINTSLALS